MSIYIKNINPLLEECTKDIRWEFHQLRSRISTEEVNKLAEALLYKKTIDWPLALLELQKGLIIKRLLNHMNFHVRKFGSPIEAELAFKGPFPAFSLSALLPKADAHRKVLHTARCIEFIGNKAWDYALKPVKKSTIPFKIEVATLALNTFGCSSKQQIEIALADLARHIKGHIINFLYDWEMLLIRQTQEQLSSYRTDLCVPISEVAV